MKREYFEKYIGYEAEITIKPNYEIKTGVLEHCEDDYMLIGGELFDYNIILRFRSTGTPSASADFTPKLDECFIQLQAQQPADILSVEYVQSFKPKTRSNVQPDAERILQKYLYAVKIHDDMPDSDRMRKIRREAAKLWDSDRDNVFAGELYAFILNLSGNKPESLKVYTRINDFNAAFALSPAPELVLDAAGSSSAYSLTPSAFAFIAGLDSQSIVSIFLRLFRTVIEDKNIDAEYRRQFFTRIAAVAYKVLNYSSWPDKHELFSEANTAALKNWLQSLPHDEEALPVSQPPKAESIRDSSRGTADIFEGEIIRFDRETIHGHIHCPKVSRFLSEGSSQNKDDVFVHLYQISDTALKKRLLTGAQTFAGLKVLFRLGIKEDGRIAAYDVRAKFSQPQADISDKPSAVEYGEVEFFDKFELFGKIRKPDGSRYSFNMGNIADPYLAVFLEYTPKSEGHPVKFIRTVTVNGRTQIDDIASASEFPADKIKAWEREGLLQKAKERVNSRQRTSEDSERISRLFNARYLPLKPFTPPEPEKVSPVIIPAETLHAAMSETHEDYYLTARRFADQKDYDEAERFYMMAIEADDKRESAAGDLLSIYIRQKDFRKFQKARSLLEKYGQIFDPEKRRNYWVQYYEASHDNDDELMRLYEEAIKFYGSFGVSRLNTKLSFTLKKAKLQQIRNDFQGSVRTCDDGLREMSSFRGEMQQNIKTISTNLKKVKTFSLSLMGKREEAASLARELLRVAALRTDTDLLAVLNGAYSRQHTNTREPISAQIRSFTELPAFLQDRIRSISIDKQLNTEFVTDKAYKKGHTDKRGNWKDAKTEYISLTGSLGGSKTANPAKADRCFALAKYVYNFLALADVEEINSYPELNEDKITFMAYKGLEYLLYYQLEQASQENISYDTARYYCLLRLGESKRTAESEKWMRIYIYSYFETGSGLLWDRKNDKWDAVSLQKLSNIDLSDRNDFDDFFEGLLSLARVIGISMLAQTLNILLYHSNPRYPSELLRKLDLTEQPAGKRSMDNEIQQRFLNALELFRNRRQKFIKDLSLPDSYELLQANSLDNMTGTLKGYRHLYGKDRIYCEALLKLLAQLKRYFELEDFDSRINLLDNVISMSGEHIHQIREHSTDYAYECFIAVLNKIRDCAAAAKAEQYSTGPELSCEIVNSSITRSGSKVTAVIAVKNRRARQKAQNLHAELVRLPEGVKHEKLNISPELAGGARSECILRLELPAYYEDSSIEFQLKLSYKYNCLQASDGGTMLQTTNGELIPPLPPVTLHDRENFKEIPNPFETFSDQGVVTDPNMMFGRDDDIDRVMKSLCADGELIRGKSIALYGQKRSGKSTLLYYVRKRIEEDFRGTALVLDMGSVGSYEYTRGMTRVIMSLIASGIQNILDYDDELYEASCRFKIIPPADSILKDDNYDIVFNNFMRSFTAFLDAQRPGCRIVLFIDEFTYLYRYIKDGKIDPSFLEFWKALNQEYGVILIMVGQDSMKQLTELSICTNALGTTKLYPVRYLTKEHSERLIRKPLEDRHSGVRIEDEAVDELFRLTYGSAYLLMILCSCIVDYLNQNMLFTVSAQTIENIADEAIRTGRISQTHFHPMYNDSLSGTDPKNLEAHDKDNLKILAAVASYADGNHEASIADLLQELREWDENTLKALLSALVQRDVLRYRDNRYKIYVGLFEEWLKHYYQGGETL